MSAPALRDVSALFVYPVKSCNPVPVESAVVLPAGLAGDRRWMLVDSNGHFQTQRRLGALARLHASLDGEVLELSYDGHDRVRVVSPGDDVSTMPVRIWNDTVAARPAPDRVTHWLREVFGKELRLVRIGSDRARRIDSDFASDEQHVSFADGFPLLLSTTASLADLESRVGQPLDMRRFRPSVVIDTDQPWEEDHWRMIRIGTVRFRVAKPCGRCVMTTRDPDTGQTVDKREPLQTLRGFHRAANGDVIFGQNLIPLDDGVVSLGDTLDVLESGASNVG